MKKLIIISIFLSFQILIFAQSYSGGSGTSGDPYQIANKTDLKYLSEHSGEWSKHFKQTANITFTDADFESGGDFYNGGEGFIPIGNNTTEFTGTYDGDGKSISNLYILQSTSSASYLGLFGKTNNATLTNINLVDAYVNGSYSTSNYIGGIVGYSTGTTSISGCTSNGDFLGYRHVGALVGRLNTSESEVSNCSSSGNVTGNADVSGLYYFGGLVGLSHGSIESSYSSATVYGYKSKNIGGLVGYNDGSISRCFATGNVSATDGGGGYAGGLVGNMYTGGHISECYATGDVISGYEMTGGLVGRVRGESITIENCYSLGDVTRTHWSEGTFGGFCGYVYQDGGSLTIKNCYSIGSVYYTGDDDPDDKGFCGEDVVYPTYTHNFFDSQASNQTTSGENSATAKNTTQMTTQNTFTNWNFNTVWQISPDVNNGYPTLQSVVQPVTEYYYRTTADGGEWEVDFADYTWTRSLTIDGSYESTYIAPTVENSALVTIVDGATVTVASNVEIDQTIVASGASLVINSGYTLTIADGDGTDLTSDGTLDINGTLSIGTANLDANGNFDATGGNLTFTDAGSLNLGGTVTSLGTFTKATSTVTYDGGNQTVAAVDYNIVSFSGSSSEATKTFADGTTSVAQEVELTDDITLTGSSADAVTVQVTTPGTTDSRVFMIEATGKTINISNLTIKGGDISSHGDTEPGWGGSIYNKAGALVLNQVTVSGSKAAFGGGIFAIRSGDVETTINNSTVSSCVATDDGGGIYGWSGIYSINNSLISGNICSGEGGGIMIVGSANGVATTEIANSTIYGNTATSGGGGILIDSYHATYASNVTISNSTVSGNVVTENNAGGGIRIQNSICSLTARNTILSGNTINNGAAQNDYYYSSGTLTDNGYNVVEYQDGSSTGAGKTFTAASNYIYSGSGNTWNHDGGSIEGSLNLSANLAENGGPTQTLALTEGSFAAASSSSGIPPANNWNNSPLIDDSYTDQRGVVRAANQNTSIGAYSENYTLYYYKSTADGGEWDVDFADYTWTRSLTIDGFYEDTYIAPTVGNSALVTIVDGATVTIASDVEIDQTIVASGASLVINSGYTLTIADGDGTDLTVNGALDMDGGTLTVSSGATLSYGSSSSLIYSDVSSSQTTTTHELPASGCVNVQILNEQGLTLGASTTISGDLYLDWACTFAIGANNFTAEGNTDINGGLTLSTGTYAANGAFDATGGSVIFIGAAALELGGTVSGLGTFTCGTGTTEYKGTADQSVYGCTYHTLAFSGGATKTATDAVITNSLTTSNENFNLILKGDGTTIANAVNFQNTGTLTLGDATSDEFSFEGGISIAETGPSAVSLQGTLQTSDAKAAGDIVLRRTTITGDATINSFSHGIDIYDNLVINDGVTLTVEGNRPPPNMAIYFHGTINSGAGGTGNLTLNSDWMIKLADDIGGTDALGTLTLANGFVEWTNPDITLENLLINQGGFVSDYSSGNMYAGNITIASGASFKGANTYGSINVSGNWTNNGTYSHQDGTVIFYGTGTSIISGSTGFYNFTCNTAGKTLKFDAEEGKSQTVSNYFNITGTSENPVVISATAAGNAASINVTNANVSYTDVTDSQNSGNTIYATNSTDNGNNTGWFFGDEGEYIWAGRTSTDWNTATNWAHNEVPNELTDNVLIPDEDNDPIISSAVGATCNNLTVNANAVLTINPGGSLITNGTINNNGTINIERSITDDIWHLIASPVSNATAAMFEGNYLQYYDEGWQDITNLTTTLTPAQGYSFWSVAETTSTTYTFTGDPNTGNQSHAITGNTWNLLGNPYPSPIDWAQLDDSYGAVYYWDPVALNNKSWNNGEGSGVQYVPAMQGFWIKPASSGTFSLNNAKRTHSGSSNYYKNKTALPYSIELQVDAQNNYYDQLFIVLDENTTEAFDFQYDAWKLFTSSEQVPQLYSFTGTKRLSIDRRPQCDQIPLGFYCSESGPFSITANEMTDFSKLILEDTKLNIFHDLTQGAYTFDWSLNDDETRFKLHLNTTAVEEINGSAVQAYVAGGNIIIQSESPAESITLTDIAGRTLGVWKSTESIPAPSSTGVYLVTVETDHKRITKKIIVE